MSRELEIELNPVDFITVGTVGPKGRRMFHLQAGRDEQIVTLTLEKEQARALGEALGEMLDDLQERYPDGAEGDLNLSRWNMDLRDPIEPLFRIAQIGLGFDEVQNMVVIVAQELLVRDDDEEDDDDFEDDLSDEAQPRIVRLWGSREQFRALSQNAVKIVSKGRADPKSNGRIIYYWT